MALRWQSRRTPRPIWRAFDDESIPMLPRSTFRVTPALARSACEHFGPLYGRELTEDEGARISTNLLGAVGVIQEWLGRAPAPPETSPSSPPSARPKRKKRRDPSNPE